MVYKVGSFFCYCANLFVSEQYFICIMRTAAGFWLKPAGNCDIVNGCLYRAYICILYAEICYI